MLTEINKSTPRKAPMISGNTCAAQALFESAINETLWTFLVRSDGTWVIARDGTQVVAGSDNLASVNSGVLRFLAFIAPVVVPVSLPAPLEDVTNRRQSARAVTGVCLRASAQLAGTEIARALEIV